MDNMAKNKIVLKESDLRKLISETVKEVAVKGKSGKNYSLHGNNGSDWATMSQVRGHKHDGSHYGKSWYAWNKDEQNYLDLTDADDNSWNERSNDAKDIADNIDEAKANKTAKNKIKLTESQLHSIIKESVKNILNEIGDTNKFYGILGQSAGYADATNNPERANRATKLSNSLQKHNNGGQLYDVHSEESAAQYRNNSRAFVNGYGKGWNNGRQQTTPQTNFMQNANSEWHRPSMSLSKTKSNTRTPSPEIQQSLHNELLKDI